MKKKWHIFLIVLLSIVSGLGDAQLQAATISGTVTADNGGVGLDNIEICVTRRAEQSLFECTTSSVDGTYTVINLPSETELIALVNNTYGQPYQFETYENQAAYDWDNGTGIDTSTSNVTGIDFALEEGFFISGTVLEDVTGNPIVGVAVCIHRTDGSFAGACRDTEAGGIYQIPALPVGNDYVAYVLGEELGYKRQMWNGIACSNNDCDFALGTPIPLLGTDVSNIDFNLEKVVPVTEQERNALVALYNSTDGLNWANSTNWLVGDPCVNAWYGVVCGIGVITEINLKENILIGSIPSDLGNLSNLTELFLNDNQLTGVIPPELSGLMALEMLELSGNQLTGTIPSELIALTQLKFMFLKENLLNGSFPAFIGSMNSLENIWISDNLFSGSIPPELGNLTNLNWLTLSRNLFTGSIPVALKNMTNLEKLHLHGNQLTGTIPAELSELTNLLQIYLYNNQLEGEIPVSLSLLTNLERLFLNTNNLTGNIPPELGDLTNMQYLFLYSNQLTGEIPSEIGNLTNLLWLYLHSNQLTSNIPSELGNILSLDRLRLYSNKLTGDVPSSLSNLVNLNDLNLSYNTLYSSDANLIDFMNGFCGCDWSQNQTIAPLNLEVIATSSDSISLNWDSVSYQQQGGYKILMSINNSGQYSEVHQTPGKTVTAYTQGNLIAETEYYFQIQTFTNPHNNPDPFESQLNLVTSESSPAIGGSTGLISSSADLYTDISLENLLRNKSNDIFLQTDIGDLLEYIIIVGNNGPDDAIGSGFRHNFPTGLINTIWACETNTGSAMCPSSNGTENVDLVLDLPLNTSLKFIFTGEVATIDEASLLITTTITPPDGVSDTELDSNNNVSNFEVIFANGFE